MTQFFNEMYTKENDDMPRAKKSQEVAVKEPESSVMKYTDADGIEQSIDIYKVPNLNETEFGQSQKLFPNAAQCFVKNTTALYDADGRQNVLGDNLVMLSAFHLPRGEFGPWFLLQCMHPEIGEITVPVPGDVCSEAVQELSGIAWKDIPGGEKHGPVKAGERFGPSQFPAWGKFQYTLGGEHDGYYSIVPAEIEVIEVAD